VCQQDWKAAATTSVAPQPVARRMAKFSLSQQNHSFSLPQDTSEILVTKGLSGFSLIVNCFPLGTHKKLHNGQIDWKIL